MTITRTIYDAYQVHSAAGTLLCTFGTLAAALRFAGPSATITC